MRYKLFGSQRIRFDELLSSLLVNKTMYFSISRLGQYKMCYDALIGRNRERVTDEK